MGRRGGERVYSLRCGRAGGFDDGDAPVMLGCSYVVDVGLVYNPLRVLLRPRSRTSIESTTVDD